MTATFCAFVCVHLMNMSSHLYVYVMRSEVLSLCVCLYSTFCVSVLMFYTNQCFFQWDLNVPYVCKAHAYVCMLGA